MEKLVELLGLLGGSLDLEATLADLDRGLRRLIQYGAIAVHLVEDGRLTPAYSAGTETLRMAALQAPTGLELAARAIQTRLPVVHSPPRQQPGEPVALALPLEQFGDVVAVLALYRNPDSAFSTGDLATMTSLGPKLASTIANACQYRRVEHLAGTDKVTGLADRRSLFRRLDAELARARRVRQPLAVAALAIEGLEQEGAVCDPSCLRRAAASIAAALREGCREYDFVARSGDEFVLVLAGFRPADLADKQQRLARLVEEIGLSAGLPLSAACGAAFFPGDGADAEDLLAAAAQRLYLARKVSSGEHRSGAQA